MRALAKFIMRGRAQALAVAFVGGLLLPYISFAGLIGLAVVGLVTLRKGLQEGVQVLLFALVGPLLLVQPGIRLISVVIPFIGIAVVAEVLRITRSWPKTLLSLAGLSALLWLALDAISTSGELKAQLMQQFNVLVGGSDSALMALFGEYSEADWLAILAVATALELLFGILLARWWQAVLYNPGGLRTELHRLRFSRLQAMVLVGLILVCTIAGEQYQLWINVVALPLLIAGVSVAHWIIGKRGLGTQTLILFYIGLIVLSPLFVPMLAVIAFTDSIVDLRHRLNGKAR